MRLLTKESRENSRAYQFEYLTKNGYKKTEGKNVIIFSHPSEFLVKTFYGTAANPEKFIKFRTAERMQNFIDEALKNSERREAYKAEQKEKNKGKLSSHAAAADAIRQELKSAFPGVKFSVKSESFAGGNSVNVNYTDGPTSDKVESIIKKYQYGHFNGMEDIYEYTNSREDIPQAKYVSAHREISKDFESEILRQIDEFIQYDFDTCGRDSKEQFVYRLAEKCDIPQAYESFKLIRTQTTCGSLEDFYTIVFECKTIESGASEPVKVEPGKIQIIEHPKRAGKILVIGETYAIKDTLKAIGGWWNKWEKGWEFKADKLEYIKAALLQAKQPQNTPIEPEPNTPEEPETPEEKPQDEAANFDSIEVLPTPENNTLPLDFFRIIWHEGRHIPGANFEDTTLQSWDEVQKVFTILWHVNEKGSGGGYTKVKCEIKLTGEAAQVSRIDITDKESNGDFNPSLQHITEYIKEDEIREQEETNKTNLLYWNSPFYRNAI